MPVNVYVQTSYASSITSINKNISPLCVYFAEKTTLGTDICSRELPDRTAASGGTLLDQHAPRCFIIHDLFFTFFASQDCERLRNMLPPVVLNTSKYRVFGLPGEHRE